VPRWAAGLHRRLDVEAAEAQARDGGELLDQPRALLPVRLRRRDARTMNEGLLLRACSLWQKESGKGRTYFVGRLGGVKILILENADRQGENDPTHNLFFAEAGERKGDGPKGARGGGPRERG
jgi:hypothetical protein